MNKLTKFSDEMSEIILKINKFRSEASREGISPLLQELESYISTRIGEKYDEHESLLTDQTKVVLRSLCEEQIIDVNYGLDYNLSLINRQVIISKSNFPCLFELICLPKEKDKGVIKENHGMGYHIHYIVIIKKKECRTNVVLTFKESKDKKSKIHKLYWEDHGKGLVKHPDQFADRRRKSLYDTSSSFLNKIAIYEFRLPKKKAEILWPI